MGHSEECLTLVLTVSSQSGVPSIDEAEYLPPYSPDFNPIEGMWSKVKSHLRSAAARTFDTICDAVADALTRVTPSDCQGYFQNCGYATATVNPL